MHVDKFGQNREQIKELISFLWSNSGSTSGQIDDVINNLSDIDLIIQQNVSIYNNLIMKNT